jgi:hypothetical protein
MQKSPSCFNAKLAVPAEGTAKARIVGLPADATYKAGVPIKNDHSPGQIDSTLDSTLQANSTIPFGALFTTLPFSLFHSKGSSESKLQTATATEKLGISRSIR